MEAVPRLPMISFHLKVSPEPATFGPKLKQYIRDFYHEDPESYTNEIAQLESLRAMAVRPPIEMAGCLLLKKYYCQLHFLQSRFPMGKDAPAAITFTWRDTYANMVCSLANIRFEIISILYNIGAMHTQLGARTERTSADGMKMACSHFQCAAWAFEHLKNSYPQPSGVDLAPELMTFMYQLCLAQAQECILEKSMLDNRKPTIVAKVARQIVDYFTLALGTLEQGGSEDGTVSDTVGTKIYKSWKRYVKFKKAYHLAVTYLYQGLAAEEQRKMGERVAFYNAALASLNEAHAVYSNAKGSIGITGAPEEKTIVEEALTFTNDVIEGKRKAAKNENEFIYHEEVPERDALPTVKGASSLVKGISFSINDPEVSGPDIFARLVPMKVHEASSLYSEEKAKLLRFVGSNIEEKDEQLMTYLASLKLDHLNLWDPDIQMSEWERLPLPDGLVERCAALNAKPQAIQELLDVMGKLSDTSQGVETILSDIQNLLNEEELKEKQYQDAVGKRPPSIVATDLTREAKKYLEAHTKALESNQALDKAITMHVKNLKILAQPLADLIAHIPSPSTYFLEQSNEKSQGERELDKARINELKRILNKVDEMRRQRSELHAKLRDSIAQDDLTRLLVTATSESGPLDRLFADQLDKHEGLVNLIDQNLAAQENILTALTDAYAQTADIRKGVEEVMKRRELTISALIVSYDTYEDLLAKSTKGLEFYRKLEINVSKLLQRVKSTCKVQEEEREQILAQESKNSYKPDVSTVSTYDQSTSRTGGNLKLKDYLNSRTDHASAHQNQYYNMYKSHTDTASTYATSKQFPNEVPVTNIQSVLPGTFPSSATVKTPYTNYKPTQYYPSYVDPKINSSYSYDPQVYGQNVNASMGQNYTSTASTGIYPISAVPTGTSEINPNVMQYPKHTLSSTEQVVSTATSIADKHYVVSQPHYNYHGPTLQYNMYQQPVDYNKHAAVQQDHTYSMLNQYDTNKEKTATVKAETAELTSQVQSMSLNAVVPPTVSNASVTNATKPEELTRNVVQQGQQYLPQNQPASNVAQNYPQDASMMQNYQLPQNEQGIVAPAAQNYMSTASYGLPVKQDQVVSNYNMYMTSTSNTMPQYMQSQCTTTSTYSTHTVSSVSAAANMNASTIPTSISSTALHSATEQYPQQQQDYAGKQYLPYNVQAQVTNANLSYPNTYQGYQYAGSSLPYQQNVAITSGISGNYASYPASNEIIQSHAKSTNISNYQQPYQYPTQGHYSNYIPNVNYSQEYNQNYNYDQTTQSSGSTIQPQQNTVYSTGNQAGVYVYNANPSTSMVAPTSSSYGLVSQSNAATNYQHQESNAMYTNASNNVMVSQTPSSQYQSQVYESQTVNGTYYTMPYGLQMQGQGSVARQDNQNTYNQTYMQAVNSGTNTTTSADPNKLASTPQEQKSNVDLLSDLDITINHAPLVPEVRPLKQEQKEEQATTNDSTETDNKKEESSTEITTTLTMTIPTTTTNFSEDKIENENLQIVWDTWYNDVQPKKDPLGDPTVLQKFITDVEKYEKFVDGLLVKTLSGATNLDIRWKEVQAFEERENGKHSSTVALANSSDNRTNDCIPYDTTRVQISSPDVGTSYINASHVTEITQWIPTAFIITQAPTPDKFEIFWTMIWEQESEVIACLASDVQLNGEIYWPTNEENVLNVGNFTISLKKTVKHPSYIQRVLLIDNVKKKAERVVVHMQFLMWPSNAFPSSPGPLLTFSTDVLTEQALRRCSPKPVIIHCTDGGSLSSLFLVAAATVCHIRAGCGIVDVPLVFKGLIKCRKQVVNKESLLFAYRMVLYHAQDILMKRGILSSTRSTFENFEGFKGNKEKTLRNCHPSDDFLQSFGATRTSNKEQQGERTSSSSNNSTHITMQDKPNVGVVDPLSQLDPLWSIRR